LQEKLDDEVLKTRLVLSNDYEGLSIRKVKPLDILAFVLVFLLAKTESHSVSVEQDRAVSRDRADSVCQGRAMSYVRAYRLLVCARDCSVVMFGWFKTWNTFDGQGGTQGLIGPRGSPGIRQPLGLDRNTIANNSLL
jgi:hypothetical protein